MKQAAEKRTYAPTRHRWSLCKSTAVRLTGFVYPPPESTLSQATVTQLDDQFFTSDPFGYIRSRILTLLNEDRPVLRGSVADEFVRLLGPSSAHYSQCDERTASLQIAVDAFALRHQVAESLLRFLHVVLHHEEGQSHWVELTDTPTKNLDVIEENRSSLDTNEDKGAARIRAALLPMGDEALGQARSGFEPTSESELDDALSVHVSWINYAIQLFLQGEPDLDAAHNKFKHGMGLRPQDDVLSTMTTIPPNPDGGVRLSSISGDHAVNLFDGITTQYLARASRRHGLETTQLAMNPAATLVEAAALAHTLGLLFHRAAAKHFSDHEPVEGRLIPAHPGLLVAGPRPGSQRPLRPFAMRFQLTTPFRAHSGPEALLFWTDGQVNTVRFGQHMRGVVVNDLPDLAD